MGLKEQGSVFMAGMQAVVAIFGIAWMGDTFIAGNMAELRGAIEGVVTQMPWLFGFALFIMSILLYSHGRNHQSPASIRYSFGNFALYAIGLISW